MEKAFPSRFWMLKASIENNKLSDDRMFFFSFLRKKMSIFIANILTASVEFLISISKIQFNKRQMAKSILEKL